MAEPSRGVVNLDIRELGPDWARYVPPKAPAGTPECGCRSCWTMSGSGALGCCGGLVDTPNIDRIAAAGLRQPLAHHGVVLPTRSCLRPCQLMNPAALPRAALFRRRHPERKEHPSIWVSVRSTYWLPASQATNATVKSCHTGHVMDGHSRPARRPDPHHEPGPPADTPLHSRQCRNFTFGFRPVYSGEG